MKAKISLLIIRQDSSLGFCDPDRLSVLLDGDKKIPSRYMGSKNEEEVVVELCEKYLNFHYEWLAKRLVGFRKLSSTEVEAVYLTTVPKLGDSHKNGSFVNPTTMSEEYNIDGYYQQLASKFGTSRQPT